VKKLHQKLESTKKLYHYVCKVFSKAEKKRKLPKK